MVAPLLNLPAPSSPYPRIFAGLTCPRCLGERYEGTNTYGALLECPDCAGYGRITVHVGPVPDEPMLWAWVEQTGLLGPVECEADARELLWCWDPHRADRLNLRDRVMLGELGARL